MPPIRPIIPLDILPRKTAKTVGSLKLGSSDISPVKRPTDGPKVYASIPLKADWEAGVVGNTILAADPGSESQFNVVSIGTNSTAVYDNTHTLGTKSAKFTVGSPSNDVYAQWSAAALGTFTDHCGGGYFWIDGYHASGTLYLIRVRGDGGECFRIGLSTTGLLRIVDTAGNIVATGTQPAPLNPNPFRITWHAIHGSFGGSVEARIYQIGVAAPLDTIKAEGVQVGYNANIVRAGINAVPAGVTNYTVYLGPQVAGLTSHPAPWVFPGRETDSPQIIVPLRTLGIGQPSETDLAQPIARVKSKTLTQPLETDTAQPITRVKGKTLLQGLESDLAQAIVRVKSKVIGQATETDLAQPVAHSRGKLIGQATETDLAQAVTHSKTVRIGQALETSIAQAVTRLKTLVLGRGSETDLAQPITAKRTRLIGQAVETDTAHHIGAQENHPILQSVETDIALPIAHAKVVHVGQATEIDQALVVSSGQVVPNDSGVGGYFGDAWVHWFLTHRRAKKPAPIIVEIGQAEETDDADYVFPKLGTKPPIIIKIGAATEISGASLVKPRRTDAHPIRAIRETDELVAELLSLQII